MAPKKKMLDIGNYEDLATHTASSLVSHLVIVDDPRGNQGKMHVFNDILAIIILGTICGCDDAERLQDWAQKEQEWLSRFLFLPHGIPSQDTYLRALAAIDPAAFSAAFIGWAQELYSMMGLKGQIAVDGKTARGAQQSDQTKNSVHMVSALACEAGLVLGQRRTGEKSNEIVAMPELLAQLNLKGELVSIDAMGCQTEIAEHIVSHGGDYLFGLKDNQPTLHEEAQAAFAEARCQRKRSIEESAPPKIETCESVDGGHGRIETRRATVCTGFEEWVPSASRFRELKALIEIQSERVDKSTGEVKRETRHYISSRPLTASEANDAVRNHWLIENRLHWCLDVTFNEDACRIRKGHAAENLVVIRHFAISILRQYAGDNYSITRRRRLCDYNRNYRLHLMSSVLAH
ncbi:ISAs1 family transposase [Myxococcota bacterium]|nr:ISAs1 family transposase [Myxococcota bacterium]